jgi:hypothetical protein
MPSEPDRGRDDDSSRRLDHGWHAIGRPYHGDFFNLVSRIGQVINVGDEADGSGVGDR